VVGFRCLSFFLGRHGVLGSVHLGFVLYVFHILDSASWRVELVEADLTVHLGDLVLPLVVLVLDQLGILRGVMGLAPLIHVSLTVVVHAIVRGNIGPRSLLGLLSPLLVLLGLLKGLASMLGGVVVGEVALMAASLLSVGNSTRWWRVSRVHWLRTSGLVEIGGVEWLDLFLSHQGAKCSCVIILLADIRPT